MTKLGPYAIDAVTQGEALALLREVPDASVDMVLTDPPYSSGGFTRGDRTADPRAKYVMSTSPDRDESADGAHVSFTGDNRDQLGWTYWCALWLDQCRRVLKPGGYLLMFCDWRQQPMATVAMQSGGLLWRGTLAWDKGEGARAPHSAYFRHQCEYVVWGTAGPLPIGGTGHGGPYAGCYRAPVKRDDKHHMTGKPTALLRELVKPCPVGGLILDPFAGSGTTLVGAYLEGRHAVGFELSPENVRISNERLAAARAGVAYVAHEAGQSALFGTGAA
jgi:site-specific DNA-methyltransferase (adenine-specific)